MAIPVHFHYNLYAESLCNQPHPLVLLTRQQEGVLLNNGSLALYKWHALHTANSVVACTEHEWHSNCG